MSLKRVGQGNANGRKTDHRRNFAGGFSGVADAANTYGSIAFSPATRIKGYSYNCPSNNSAMQRALY